jgi:hypothetical protein
MHCLQSMFLKVDRTKNEGSREGRGNSGSVRHRGNRGLF